MRRTASEVLRSLEMRVARLEGKYASKTPWDNLVSQMKKYFERKVGGEFRGTDFEIDARTPSDTSKISRQYQNSATLVFILNGEGVYVDAYEYEERGRKFIGYNLMAQDGRHVLYSSSKNLTPGAKDLPPKIINELKKFVAEPVDRDAVQRELNRALQEDYIDEDLVSSLRAKLR